MKHARDDRVMRPVRVGLTGAGRIVRDSHVPAYHANQDQMTVMAIADPDEQAAALVADQLPGARRFPSLTAMLDAGGIDLVVVATPPDAHHGAVVEALHRGIAVICEKPLCVDLNELESIRAATGCTGFLALMHNYLTSPGWHQLINLIRQGRIGRPTMVRFEELADDHWRPPGSSSLWLEQRERSGGPLRDNLYHPLYLAEQLLDSPVHTASGQQAALVHDYSAGDTAMMTARHHNGTLTQALAAWGYQGQSRATVEVCGTEAVARYSYWAEPDQLWIDDGRRAEQVPVSGWTEDLDSGHVPGFRKIVSRFLRGAPPPWSVADAERILRVTLQVPAIPARMEARHA
jgi:predicted dehydrogenase